MSKGFLDHKDFNNPNETILRRNATIVTKDVRHSILRPHLSGLQQQCFIKVSAHRNIKGHSFHIHFVDDKDKGLVPVGVQVAALHACLLLLPNPLLFGVKQFQLHIRIRCSSDIHLLQFPGLQHSHYNYKVAVHTFGNSNITQLATLHSQQHNIASNITQLATLHSQQHYIASNFTQLATLHSQQLQIYCHSL